MGECKVLKISYNISYKGSLYFAIPDVYGSCSSSCVAAATAVTNELC